MDPYVVVGLNADKKRTRQIEDGGSNCTFNETLHFNIDAQKQDLVHIKVKTETTFSSATIGVFSLQLKDFIKYQKRRLKFQLIDEDSFEDRGSQTTTHKGSEEHRDSQKNTMQLLTCILPLLSLVSLLSDRGDDGVSRHERASAAHAECFAAASSEHRRGGVAHGGS